MVTPGVFVSKEITVEASQARAFDVFTRELGAWWPLATHHIGTAPAETAIIEPRAGGRWFERSADGRECEWGRVLVWDPPGRLVLSWEISADFKHDESIDTEVEVSFVSLGPALTRVELEHRRLDSYGAAVDKMRGIFDSENGWTWILRSFASRARDAGKA
jgi:Activator of Hsp90 ATPase homolog 1-like protein